MERPNHKGSDNFIVGLFVFVALLVGAGFVVFMGGTSKLSGMLKVQTVFRDVRGLNIGAPVFMSGIQIGRVNVFRIPEVAASEADFPGITAILTVESGYADRVRANSRTAISTQGMLGDKVVTISPGSLDSPVYEEGQLLVAETPKELSDYLSKGGNLVEELNKLTVSLNRLVEEITQDGKITKVVGNLEKSTASLNALTQTLKETSAKELDPALRSLKLILTKIEKGQGTLGALINDPSLHEDMKILLGGAKRSQLIRFAIREAIKSKEEKKEK